MLKLCGFLGGLISPAWGQDVRHENNNIEISLYHIMANNLPVTDPNRRFKFSIISLTEIWFITHRDDSGSN